MHVVENNQQNTLIDILRTTYPTKAGSRKAPFPQWSNDYGMHDYEYTPPSASGVSIRTANRHPRTSTRLHQPTTEHQFRGKSGSASYPGLNLTGDRQVDGAEPYNMHAASPMPPPAGRSRGENHASYCCCSM
ncbi:unnamed protein product [Ectocarpus sp. 12 AP-2014]